MSSIVERLTEGIVNRDMRAEGHALLNKWERTGLLEGIENERSKQSMARLLENQAKELLRENSTMAGGSVEGFAAVAFPIVRRVFAGLIANDLVSVQPMSLPSGLIFFLDFTTSTDGAGLPRLGWTGTEESLYGGGAIGSQLTGGVDLTGSFAEAGPYGLNNGYASPTGSTDGTAAMGAWVLVASGVVGGTDSTQLGTQSPKNQATLDGLCQYDPDLSGTCVAVVEMTGTSDGNFEQLNTNNLVGVSFGALGENGANVMQLVRRCTRISSGSTGDTPGNANWKMTMVIAQVSGAVVFENGTRDSLIGQVTCSVADTYVLNFPVDDNFTTSTALGSVIGTTEWGLENEQRSPRLISRWIVSP